MFWLQVIVGGIVLYKVGKFFGVIGDESYTDQNGVEWRIWDSGPWWEVGTDGYGGKFTNVQGFTSREQAIEIIEGNAAQRDPETGDILY